MTVTQIVKRTVLQVAVLTVPAVNQAALAVLAAPAALMEKVKVDIRSAIRRKGERRYQSTVSISKQLLFCYLLLCQLLYQRIVLWSYLLLIAKLVPVIDVGHGLMIEDNVEFMSA